MMNNYSIRCKAIHHPKKVVWVTVLANNHKKTSGLHRFRLNMPKKHIGLGMQMTPDLVPTLRRTYGDQGRIDCLANIDHLGATGMKSTSAWWM